MTEARPGPGVQAFFLDETCVLFSEPRQEIVALNGLAGFIWCSLEEGGDPVRIAADLQATFRLSPTQAASFVDMALEDWRDRGLLAGAPGADPPQHPEPEPADTLPPRGDPVFVAERTYRLLETRLAVRFTSPDHLALVDPILAHLACAGSGGADHLIDIVGTPDRIVLYRDGEGTLSCRRDDEIGPLAKSLVWSTAVNGAAFSVTLHAGVVATPAGAILFPAPSGSGKSTLTALFVHAGFEYLSDESAPLRAPDLQVVPVPLSLCIKTTGFSVLERYFPAIPTLPVHARFDGKTVAYLPPPRGGSALPDSPRPVRAVIFPRFVAGASAALAPVSKGEALERILQQCMVVRGRLDAPRVKELVDWINRTPCHELTFGAADECIALARSLLEGGLPDAGGPGGSAPDGARR